ncbi:MAG: hypothetical protein ACTTKJ_06680 [Prevotella koreensis]|uniref:hypothetical protein n=1 Tax=Prevotella koreensis TaxID=2490854 RepID=UPI003F9EFAD8
MINVIPLWAGVVMFFLLIGVLIVSVAKDLKPTAIVKPRFETPVLRNMQDETGRYYVSSIWHDRKTGEYFAAIKRKGLPLYLEHASAYSKKNLEEMIDKKYLELRKKSLERAGMIY